MRRLRHLIRWLLLLLLVGLALLIWLLLSDQPLVDRPPALTAGDLAQVERLLRRNDPRRLAPGSVAELRLQPQELNLLAHYLALRYRLASRFELADGQLTVHATLPLPGLPWYRYLNLTLVVVSEAGQPRPAALLAGRLALPASGLAVLLPRVLRWLPGDTAQLADSLERLELTPAQLTLRYHWDPQLIEQTRSGLLNPNEHAALGYYHRRLVELQHQGVGLQGSLVPLLQAMFTLAQYRSTSSDPVAENRQLLLLLGSWAGGRGLGLLLPRERRTGRLRRFRLTLAGQDDLAQHFLVSAGLAAASDSELSDAVGLFKEVRDADHGSGFSFTDLTADRAGSRFGERAVRSSLSARQLQQRMAAGVTDGTLLPPLAGLPGPMTGSQFRDRFTSPDSEAYRQIERTIDQRIELLPLYR